MKKSVHISTEQRDSMLKSELPAPMVKILERYRLVATNNDEWFSEEENAHQHKIFTQKFLKNTDEIGALFRVNKLCMAKVNYFRKNIEKFTPMKYDPVQGFVAVEFWDSDFLCHNQSGLIIDYRFLERITNIEVFKAFCITLET